MVANFLRVVLKLVLEMAQKEILTYMPFESTNFDLSIRVLLWRPGSYAALSVTLIKNVKNFIGNQITKTTI